MDQGKDGWRHTVKNRLKPLRDRLVHRLGGTLPERGLTYEQLVHLLYPTLPDELRHDVDEAAAGDLAQVSTIRKMLGTIEHQVAPTTFSVQLGAEDALRCTVGGVELLCDVADAAVTPGLRSGEYELHLTAVFERYCTTGHDGGRRRRQPRATTHSWPRSWSGRRAVSSPSSRARRTVVSCCRHCAWAVSPTST